MDTLYVVQFQRLHVFQSVGPAKPVLAVFDYLLLHRSVKVAFDLDLMRCKTLFEIVPRCLFLCFLRSEGLYAGLGSPGGGFQFVSSGSGHVVIGLNSILNTLLVQGQKRSQVLIHVWKATGLNAPDRHGTDPGINNQSPEQETTWCPK
jgi:hypothetical protein